MRIAHLTDVHLGPFARPPLPELLSKRALGYANWQRKRKRIHQAAILERIVTDLKRHEPDLIAVTGDLVNVAASTEWHAARRFLEHLGPPGRVFLVPGNHDVYVSSAVDAVRKIWGDYLIGDGDRRNPLAPAGLANDPHRGFPWLALRGDVALIGCSSAVATRAFMATGRLGSGQIERLRNTLIETGAKGLCRIVLIHHPPLTRLGRPRRALDDAEALTDVLTKAGAEAILYGHNHTATLDWIEHASGRAAVIGTASASAIAYKSAPAAQYALIDVRRDGSCWTLTLTRRGLGVDDEVHTLDHRELRLSAASRVTD
ncbi:MAG: metallophosphoesterase [Pseudomonadota bacterium]